MDIKRALSKLCACLLFLMVALPSWGRCTKTSTPQTEDGRTALIPFGKINLADNYFAPAGSLLASVVVPPTNYTYNGATGASVLWECDARDLPNIYFLVATNGDDRVGGYYNIGGVDGLTDVYATWFEYVGLRQTMAGVTLTRFWKKVPVTSYATSGSKIQIRLQDIPPLQAELYKISSVPPTSGSGSAFCGRNNNDGSGIGKASATGRLYSCTQPNGYVQLAGNDNVLFAFAHDKQGEDAATNFRFWGADNGFGYGMRTANRLYQKATCVARSATPVVRLPAVSVAELNSGGVVTGNFSVQIECSNNAARGTGDGQTALGLQVSEGAYSAARALGLINGRGGVKALVSDNYFASDVAKGVGITVAYSNTPGTPITFIGQPGLVSLTPGGNAAGWYSVGQGVVQRSDSIPGYSFLSYDFIATLKKLDSRTVTPGKVHATAYVLVKMQ